MKRATLIPMTAPLNEADASPWRRFLWLRRMVIGVGFFAIFAVSSYLWLCHREHGRLAEEIQRWRTAGLPISFEDFASPVVPDEENAAVAVSRAARAYVSDPQWVKADVHLEFEQLPWSAGARAIADQALLKNVPALAALRKARGLTAVWWEPLKYGDLYRDKKGPHQPDWSSLRELANMVRVHARTAHQRGDDAEFLEDVADLRFLARVCTGEPMMVSQLVARGIDMLAASLVVESAQDLRVEGETGIVLRYRIERLIDDFLAGDATANSVRAIAREAAAYLELAASDRPLPEFSFGPDFKKLPRTTWEILAWRVLRPVRLRQTTEILTRSRGEIPAAGMANWPATLAALPRPAPLPPAPAISVEPIGTALDLLSIAANGNGRYLQWEFRHQVYNRFAAVKLASRLYAADHQGRAPANLRELCPQYLPMVPLDPFDARQSPLRYVAATQPFVYSVGDRGIDLIGAGKYTPPFSTSVNWNVPNWVCLLSAPSPLPPATSPASPKAKPK